MILYIAIGIYVAALVAANLAVAKFGPVVMPILAFVLIGMDLALRNWLQVRLPKWQMAALILGTGVLTYMLNPAAQIIAIASSVSFAAAALTEWGVFSSLSGSWRRRSIGGAIAGAAVDSLLFPTIAFGALMPVIVLAQFAAKVAGGALWTWALSRSRIQTDTHMGEKTC